MLDYYKTEQPIIYKSLINSAIRNKITHAYLLETKGYSKGVDFALAVAKFLLCEHNYTNSEKCEDCVQCKVVEDRNHLEVKVIHPDGQWIKKEQIEELQQEFSKKAVIGNKKIYIINGVDKLNVSSSNSILKFLEEPQEGIIAILLVDSISKVLDTIVSRCQILSFKQERKELSDTKNRLAVATFNQLDDIEKFLSDDATVDKIELLVHYIDFYEKNAFKTIIYKNKELLGVFSDKELMQVAFKWLILYYKDALNVLLGRQTDFFDDYKESLENTAKTNDKIKIAKKLEILVNLSETIKFNANANMLLDRLVIELGEV